MLVLTYAALATVDELFRYKSQGFKLDDFPGYTADQWGIKAHNRPWIEEVGRFTKGHRIIEVGGGYSLLPRYLVEKYELEAWIGDDFGMSSGEPLWSRWGDPLNLPRQHPSVKYVFEKFGNLSPDYPDAYFDRVFTVSTLEHISVDFRLAVLKDMHRCLKPSGRQLHTIDIGDVSPSRNLKAAIAVKLTGMLPLVNTIVRKHYSQIWNWIEIIKASGVKITVPVPNLIQLLDRQILVESPDVIYRFYPPNNAPKAYHPAASLLLIIENQ